MKPTNSPWYTQKIPDVAKEWIRESPDPMRIDESPKQISQSMTSARNLHGTVAKEPRPRSGLPKRWPGYSERSPEAWFDDCWPCGPLGSEGGREDAIDPGYPRWFSHTGYG